MKIHAKHLKYYEFELVLSWCQKSNLLRNEEKLGKPFIYWQIEGKRGIKVKFL